MQKVKMKRAAMILDSSMVLGHVDKGKPDNYLMKFIMSTKFGDIPRENMINGGVRIIQRRDERYEYVAMVDYLEGQPDTIGDFCAATATAVACADE